MTKLQRARLLSEKTRKESADFMNVSPYTIGSWERNPLKMTINNAVKLCKFYDADFREIFLPNDATKSNIAQEESYETN